MAIFDYEKMLKGMSQAPTWGASLFGRALGGPAARISGALASSVAPAPARAAPERPQYGLAWPMGYTPRSNPVANLGMGIGGALMGQQLGGFLGFPAGMQSAMGQIGAAGRFNVDSMFRLRQLAAATQIARERNQIAREQATQQNQLIQSILGAFGAGRGAVPSAPAAAPALAGVNQGEAAASRAGENVYQRLLARIGGAPFAPTTIGGATLTAPGQAPATLGVGPPPGIPSLAPGAPTGSIGNMGITPTPIWGPESEAALRGRIGAFAGQTMPYLGGEAGGGLAQSFRDALAGGAGRTFATIARAGGRAQAEQGLQEQQAQANIRNQLWRLIAQMYQGNLARQLQEGELESRMLGGLLS